MLCQQWVSLSKLHRASHQWLQLQLCCHPTKYHLFQSEHHGLPEHNSSPSVQAWGYECSNMHWRPSHKSWYHNNAIHHSKPAIVSSKYQTYTQRPFVRSPNSSRSILQEMNSQHRHRDKSTWNSECSCCCQRLKRNSILLHSAICSVIPPQDILIPTRLNIMNVRIVLNDLLVISPTKLWTVDGQNPAIEIGNTLKRKTGISPYPWCNYDPLLDMMTI